VGATHTGGSTLSNLEKGELIDVLTAGTVTAAGHVATAGLVTGTGKWAFETANHTLTWWDHAGVESLTLQFAAGASNVDLNNNHSFVVIK
jgi:hypothetical protein